MSTISVPLPSFLEEFIKKMVDSGQAANKADVVRRALMQYREDEAFNAIMQASQEVKEGKIYSGNIEDLVKKYGSSKS